MSRAWGRSSGAQIGLHIHVEPCVPPCSECCVSGMPALPGDSETRGPLQGHSRDIRSLGSPTFLGCTVLSCENRERGCQARERSRGCSCLHGDSLAMTWCPTVCRDSAPQIHNSVGTTMQDRHTVKEGLELEAPCGLFSHGHPGVF